MAVDSKKQDDSFEVLDLSEISNGTFFKKTFKDLSKASAAKQIAVGGGCGACAGYLFARVGKAAAGAIGGSLLILQIANHQGLITINWGKLERKVNSAKKEIKKEANRSLPNLAENVKDFVAENLVLAGSFAGGFLIGLAC